MFRQLTDLIGSNSFNIAVKRENIVCDDYVKANSSVIGLPENMETALKFQPIFINSLRAQPIKLSHVKSEPIDSSQDQNCSNTSTNFSCELLPVSKLNPIESPSDLSEPIQSTFKISNNDESLDASNPSIIPSQDHSNPIQMHHIKHEAFQANLTVMETLISTKSHTRLEKSSVIARKLVVLPFIKTDSSEIVVKSEHLLTSHEYSHNLISDNYPRTWENSVTGNISYLNYNQSDNRISNNVFCGECNRGFPSKRTLSYHVVTVHKKKKTFVCCKCNRAFTVKGSLIRHIQVVHENLKKYTCDACNRLFSSKVPLSNHIDSAHLKIKRNRCGYCDRLFSTNDYLKFHIASVHENLENRHFCEVCNRSFSHKNSLRRHYANCHITDILIRKKVETYKNLNKEELEASLDLNQFSPKYRKSNTETGNINYSDNVISNNSYCQECNWGFTSEKTLGYHIRTVHKKNKTLMCCECTHTFTVKASLIRHIRIVHENVKRYACDGCNRSFSSKIPLSNHIDSAHLNIKRYTCGKCDQLFATHDYLKIHIATVHDKLENPHTCKECNRSFSHKNSLKRHHANYHINNPLNREKGTSKCLISGYNKNFFCNFCDNAFYRRDLLERHILKSHKNLSKEQLESSLFSVQELNHSPRKYRKREKEHVCNDCNRAYCSEKALKNHIANHKNGEDNFCAECQRSFAHKWNLKSHIEAFHSTKYPCDLCNATFTRHLDLKKHVRVHKSIICLECNLKFSHNWKYTKHFDNVHRERAFKCNTCDKGFSHKCYLKRHVQDVHLNVRNFECAECNRKFCRRSGLACHMNTRHRHLFGKTAYENLKLK